MNISSRMVMVEWGVISDHLFCILLIVAYAVLIYLVVLQILSPVVTIELSLKSDFGYKSCHK